MSSSSNDKHEQRHMEFSDSFTNSIIAPTSGLEGAATNYEREHDHNPPKFFNTLQRYRYAFREYLAEFFGVFVMILLGDGCCAQVTTSAGKGGDWTVISIGWACAVYFGYQCSAGISGGHLNPSITVTAAVFRKFPWKKVPGYIFSQFLGGYLAALLVYGLYMQAINNYEGGPDIRTVTGDHATAGIFSTYAQSFLSTKGQVTSEIVGAAVLQIGIFSLTDPYNAALGPSFPFGLFILLLGIGTCVGWQTGYAINLARDFGPRLAAATVGYGSEVFSYGDYYFWVPLIIPIIGCLTGAFFYDLFIYQGLDSPLNQKNFGIHNTIHEIKSFKLADLRPDFDIERAEFHNKA